MTWALVGFAAWCLDNLDSAISGRLAAVQHFHRMMAQVEFCMTHLLIKMCYCGALLGLTVARGTPHRVRLPVTWSTLRDKRESNSHLSGVHKVLCRGYA